MSVLTAAGFQDIRVAASSLTERLLTDSEVAAQTLTIIQAGISRGIFCSYAKG
jgi:hypothetical protein